MDNSIREKITESFFVISEIGVNLFHYDYVYKVQFSVSLCNLVDIVHSAFLSVIFGPFSAKLTRLKSIRLRHIEFTSLIKFSKFCTNKYLQTVLTQTLIVCECKKLLFSQQLLSRTEGGITKGTN